MSDWFRHHNCSFVCDCAGFTCVIICMIFHNDLDFRLPHSTTPMVSVFIWHLVFQVCALPSQKMCLLASSLFDCMSDSTHTIKVLGLFQTLFSAHDFYELLQVPAAILWVCSQLVSFSQCLFVSANARWAQNKPTVLVVALASQPSEVLAPLLVETR